MKFEIKNTNTHEVQFCCELEETFVGQRRSVQLGEAIKIAVSKRTTLYGADLRGADLHGVSLHGANLCGAYLRNANLEGADLEGADLHGADLHGADLEGANLCGADFYDANLCDVNLRCANLCGASLEGTDLRGASLEGTDLRGADLRGANLNGANLRGTKGANMIIAQTRILPEGDLIGWKKCDDDVIVKLLIPSSAKRSHAFGRKCRAEFADVLEVFGAEVGVTTLHGPRTEYRAGKRVVPNGFDDNWQNECSSGIHFFITRIEAENY
jgi:uncharacterized protein YjbI with pentapeptide repeats